MTDPLLQIIDFNAWQGSRQVLSQVNLTVGQNNVLSIIGPMGSGKSTLLRCINRLFGESPDTKTLGNINFLGKDVYESSIDLLKLRKQVGMVFSDPAVFTHMSVFENVAIGLRLSGVKSGAEIGEAVETALERVKLWGAVKKNVHGTVAGLSTGDQQRLCIARAIVLKPKILLMDEPTSSLNLQEAMRLEEMIRELSDRMTIIFATSSRKQAARISDQTAFLLDGELIEFGKTSDLFMNPQDARTEDYLTGRFG